MLWNHWFHEIHHAWNIKIRDLGSETWLAFARRMTFTDFQERIPVFVVLQDFSSMSAVKRSQYFSINFWFYMIFLQLFDGDAESAICFSLFCFGAEHLNSAFEFGMLRICQNIKFLSERFSNLLRLLLSYNWAYLKNENYMFGLTMLCEFEDFS